MLKKRHAKKADINGCLQQPHFEEHAKKVLGTV